MKKNLFLVMALSAAVFTFSSCEKDEANNDKGNGKTDPSTIASANLVAHFPFETGAVTAAGITFDKAQGTASFVPGRRGKAFKGADASYLKYNVTAANKLTAMKEFTFTMWVKAPATTDGAAKIFSLNGGDSFMGNLVIMQESQPVTKGDSLDIKCYLFNTTSEWKGQDMRIQKPAFTNDKWFHFAYIYRAATSTLEYWANGEKVAETIRYAGPEANGKQPLLGALTLDTKATQIIIGAWEQAVGGTPDGWMKYFKGMIDELRVYNKALNAAEMKALYNAEIENIN